MGTIRDELERRRRLLDARHPQLLEALIDDLKGGRTQPQLPTDISNLDLRKPQIANETRRIARIKDYFDRLKQRCNRKQYLRYVKIYEQGCLRFMRSEPLVSEREEFPLVPPHPSRQRTDLFFGDSRKWPAALPSLHAGGRKVSPNIQKRNDLIRELKSRGTKHINICKKLDAAGCSPPPRWRNINSWTKAYRDADLRNRIHALFSKSKSIDDTPVRHELGTSHLIASLPPSAYLP